MSLGKRKLLSHADFVRSIDLRGLPEKFFVPKFGSWLRKGHKFSLALAYHHARVVVRWWTWYQTLDCY